MVVPVLLNIIINAHPLSCVTRHATNISKKAVPGPGIMYLMVLVVHGVADSRDGLPEGVALQLGKDDGLDRNRRPGLNGRLSSAKALAAMIPAFLSLHVADHQLECPSSKQSNLPMFCQAGLLGK